MSKQKQRTFEDGQKIVKQLQSSGLSRVRFAKKIGISVAVVNYWVHRLRTLKAKTKSEGVKFVEVLSAPTNALPSVSIELPGGIILKTGEIPSPEYLVELSSAYQNERLC